MDDLPAALERLHKFSQSWNDDDVVDEESGLTGADLRMVVDRGIVFPRNDRKAETTD